MPVEIDPFHAIAISRLAHQLRAEGRSVIHMEFGQPSTGAPAAAIETAHHILDKDGMGYWESPGLKARIAAHYGEAYGVSVNPEQVILTCVRFSPPSSSHSPACFRLARGSPWLGPVMLPTETPSRRCISSRSNSPAAKPSGSRSRPTQSNEWSRRRMD